MKSLRALLIAVTVAFFACDTATTVTAKEPAYLILRAPARTHHGHPYYPGRGYAVSTQAYAYGWFGAQPRRHLRRSTGYYESHIRWSKQ